MDKILENILNDNQHILTYQELRAAMERLVAGENSPEAYEAEKERVTGAYNNTSLLVMSMLVCIEMLELQVRALGAEPHRHVDYIQERAAVAAAFPHSLYTVLFDVLRVMRQNEKTFEERIETKKEIITLLKEKVQKMEKTEAALMGTIDSKDASVNRQENLIGRLRDEKGKLEGRISQLEGDLKASGEALARALLPERLLEMAQRVINAHPKEQAVVKQLMLMALGEEWRAQVEALHYLSPLAEENERLLPMERLAEARRGFLELTEDYEYVEQLINQIALCPGNELLKTDVMEPMYRAHKLNFQKTNAKALAKLYLDCIRYDDGASMSRLQTLFSECKK